MAKPIAVAGAGLTGAVLARELAERGGKRVLVFEERSHVGGHCHTERDVETGVLVHVHGAHVFHTSRADVWAYVNRFASFRPFLTRVKAVTARGVFSMPVNLLTINQFFGTRFGPREARAFVVGLAERGPQPPRNFEEQALSLVGRDLYAAFFRGYTRKQWGRDPKDLPASIFRRLPLRFDYNDDYFDDVYQGVPEEGYTELIRRMLDHPLVELRLGEKLGRDGASELEHLFFSGPLDSYFGYAHGRLRYRTLRFERFVEEGDFQGGPMVTYCEEEVPHTRIVEHKHFAPWERFPRTLCHRERSDEAGPEDVPYYPLRLSEDDRLLGEYVREAQALRGVTFAGRLGSYRYLDMHVVVGEAIDLAARYLAHDPGSGPFPAFSASPLGPRGAPPAPPPPATWTE
jgi:UDP-galactopyranose mutase